MIVSKRVAVRPNPAFWAALMFAAASALIVAPTVSSLANNDADTNASAPGAQCTITLKDGSSIKGSILTLEKDQLVIKLHANEPQLASTSLVDIADNATAPFEEVWELSLDECLRIALQNKRGVQIVTRLNGPSLVVTESDKTDNWEFCQLVEKTVRDVETVYWDLWLAHQDLAAVKLGRDNARANWREMAKVLRSNGQNSGDEARSRLQYFNFRSQAEQCLTDLYKSESRLRYLLGMATNDGRVIRPSDQPDLEHGEYDWREVQEKALTNRKEIVKQKQEINKRERELEQSRADDGSTVSSKTRNAELVLAREKAILNDLELEVSHQVGDAIREVAMVERLIETNFNRVVAEKAEIAATQASFRAGIASLDLVQDCQRREVEAKRAHNKTRADYMKSVANVEYRKGSPLSRYNLEFVKEE